MVNLNHQRHLLKLKDKDFNKEVLESDKVVLIDFWAPWCAPCRMMEPVIEQLAAEYDGEIYIYKINTEEEQELAALFGIRSIPSLLFVPMGGEQPQMAQGALPKPNLKEAIDKVLLKK